MDPRKPHSNRADGKVSSRVEEFLPALINKSAAAHTQAEKERFAHVGDKSPGWKVTDAPTFSALGKTKRTLGPSRKPNFASLDLGATRKSRFFGGEKAESLRGDSAPFLFVPRVLVVLVSKLSAGQVDAPTESPSFVDLRLLSFTLREKSD